MHPAETRHRAPTVALGKFVFSSKLNPWREPAKLKISSLFACFFFSQKEDCDVYTGVKKLLILYMMLTSKLQNVKYL